MRLARPLLLAVAGLALFARQPLAARGPDAAQSPDVLIFAASSLTTALDALAAPIRQATGVAVRMSYAASSALARQIEQGAPADLFISADLDWMDYVAERNLVKKDTRINLLSNTLVLVAPARDAARQRPLVIAPGFGLAAALGGGRLALADPESVPAGKYAKAALTSLGVWDAIAAHVAPAENVRAALVLVSRGEAPYGIVYRTDAKADPGVTVVGTFPETSHPPIVYPAAQTTTASDRSGSVLAFLTSPAARVVFEAQGFTFIAGLMR